MFKKKADPAVFGLDDVSKEQLAEFLGRDPHPSSSGDKILYLKQPDFPHLRFEWHPQSRKVYMVRLHTQPVIGEIIAEHAETHGLAYGFVQTFLRGYREALTPNVRKPHLER